MKLQEIYGIGEKTEKYLNELSIYNLEGLLNFFPSKYYEAGNLSTFADGENVFFVGEVASQLEKGIGKNKKNYFKFLAKTQQQDEEKFVQIYYFNCDYLAKEFEYGKKFLFFGKQLPSRKEQKIPTFINPKQEKFGENLQNIFSVYSLKGKIFQKTFSKIVQNVLQNYQLKSVIPQSMCQKFKLPDYEQSVATMHFPREMKFVEIAKKRILTERLFEIMMQYRLFKERAKEKSLVQKYSASDIDNIKLPFEMTKGQKGAIDKIFELISAKKTANILLQGDVGCGKTLVATLVASAVAKRGGQVAVLCPTEVLATQHKSYFSQILPDCKVEKLTSVATAKERKSILQRIKNKEIDILIGTQSLFSSEVEFANLKLAIIDEQHKFGVFQRSILQQKGEDVDLFCMSATPICRTLSLTLYGDLDLVLISDKPQGRKPIENYVVGKKNKQKLLDFLKTSAQNNESVYVVCPSIDTDEDIASVMQLYDEWKDKFGVKIGILHSKLTADEKDIAISDFAEKKTNILICTTVVEVGVDVKSANIMIIWNAERFGLSQLHQLRGRIGRNDRQATCVFYTEKSTQNERLLAIKSTNDGFEIAEKDFLLRGAGEYLGFAQSGFCDDGLFSNLVAVEYAKKIVEQTEIDQEFCQNFWDILQERNKKIDKVILN